MISEFVSQRMVEHVQRITGNFQDIYCKLTEAIDYVRISSLPIGSRNTGIDDDFF